MPDDRRAHGQMVISRGIDSTHRKTVGKSPLRNAGMRQCRWPPQPRTAASRARQTRPPGESPGCAHRLRDCLTPMESTRAGIVADPPMHARELRKARGDCPHPGSAGDSNRQTVNAYRQDPAGSASLARFRYPQVLALRSFWHECSRPSLLTQPVNARHGRKSIAQFHFSVPSIFGNSHVPLKPGYPCTPAAGPAGSNAFESPFTYIDRLFPNSFPAYPMRRRKAVTWPIAQPMAPPA